MQAARAAELFAAAGTTRAAMYKLWQHGAGADRMAAEFARAQEQTAMIGREREYHLF